MHTKWITYDLKELAFQGVFPTLAFQFPSGHMQIYKRCNRQCSSAQVAISPQTPLLACIGAQIPKSGTSAPVCEAQDDSRGTYSIETEVPCIFPLLARRALARRAEHDLAMIPRVRKRHVCQCFPLHPLVVWVWDIRRQQWSYARKDTNVALELLHHIVQPSAHHLPLACFRLQLIDAASRLFEVNPETRYRLGGPVVGRTESGELRLQLRVVRLQGHLRGALLGEGFLERCGGFALPAEVLARSGEVGADVVELAFAAASVRLEL